jgi:hypothetical protein
MALSDSPDGTLWVQNVSVVVETPTPSEPAKERAAGDTGRYSGSSQSYQEVASWTVATGKVGELKEITLLSDEYDYTEWRITVGAVTFAEDWIVQAAMPIIFEDLRLAAGTEVKVEARSTDGTAIVADVCITGKELGA